MTGIIVGIDGSENSRHALMGSVSTQVAHHAPYPVVVIPDVT